MEREELTTRHYWLRQARHVVCFLLVIAFVVFYSLDAFAYTINDQQSMAAYFGIDADVTYPIMGRSSAYAQAQQNGIDTSQVISSIFDYYQATSLNVSVGEWNNILKNSLNLPLSYSDDNGISYDLSNAYHFITCESYGGGAYPTGILVFLGDYMAIVNNYVVSASPFYVFKNFACNSSGTISLEGNLSGYGHAPIFVSAAENNGLYCYQLTSWQGGSGINMCDMDIFAPSTDGSTGFTNFSVTSTNLDLNGNNYNFNFLKSGYGIIGGSDPQPISVGDAQANAYHNMNVTMRNSYSGFGKNGNLWGHMYINWNDYIRSFPELFDFNYDYHIVLKFVTATGTESTYEYDRSLRIGVDDIFRMKDQFGWSESYRIVESMWNFKQPSGVIETNLESDLSYATNAIAGTSSDILNWMNLVETFGNEIAELWDLKPTFLFGPDSNRGIKEFYMTGRYYLSCDDPATNTEVASGLYEDTFNFLTNEYTVGTNDISINLYPYENGAPTNLPSNTINYGTGNNGSGVSYGGSNNAYSQAQGGQGGNATVTINPPFEPYTLSMGEYGDMADIFTGIRDAFQSVGGGSSTRYASGTENNSGNNFISIIAQTFSFLPAQVWQVMTISISIVSGVAVVKFVRNRR